MIDIDSTLITALLNLTDKKGSFRVLDASKKEIDWMDDSIARPTDSDIQAEMDKILAEAPLNALRKQRDRIIAESDWRMTIDYAGTDQEEWKTYRQVLRDITNTYSSLDDVVWPETPA